MKLQNDLKKIDRVMIKFQGGQDSSGHGVDIIQFFMGIHGSRFDFFRPYEQDLINLIQ